MLIKLIPVIRLLMVQGLNISKENLFKLVFVAETLFDRYIFLTYALNLIYRSFELTLERKTKNEQKSDDVHIRHTLKRGE
jgi:hypothetical protein